MRNLINSSWKMTLLLNVLVLSVVACGRNTAVSPTTPPQNTPFADSDMTQAETAETTRTPLLTLNDIPNGFDGPTIIDITSTTATIRFDTGIPTVCNAPYGETAEYGQVATIPMLNGATLDHVLTFPDLKPDTTYHYRITVTDINGRVYQSEDFTFTTLPEEETAVPQKTNWLSLAAGAKVTGVSSNFGGATNEDAWGANMAIDGRTSTAWSSNGDGDNAWIEITLPQKTHIRQLEVWTRTMSNNTAQIFSFTVTTETGDTFGPFDLPDANQPYLFDVDITAERLRFDAEVTNGGNTGFVELAAYGEPAE